MHNYTCYTCIIDKTRAVWLVKSQYIENILKQYQRFKIYLILVNLCNAIYYNIQMNYAEKHHQQQKRKPIFDFWKTQNKRFK